jgi:hypothetical protein
VVTELSPLLRGYELADDSADLVAEIEDLGESYRVSVAGASREVRDPARRCLERAQVAAVFFALNLPQSVPRRGRGSEREPTSEGETASKREPAERVPTSAETSAQTPRRDAEPKSAPETPPPRPARALELRPFASAEGAWGAGATSTGAGLGLSLRVGSLALTVVGAATTSSTPYRPSDAPPRFQMRRWPFAALVGWETTLSTLRLGAEMGGALDVLAFDGKVVPNPDRALRLNPGLRVNGVLRVQATRNWAAELLPVVSWYPRPYRVRVAPSQLLAESPVVWLGVVLGINYEIWDG